MIAVVDIGNTQTKLAVFQNSIIIHEEIFNQSEFKEKISKLSNINVFVLSEVANYKDEVYWLQLHHKTFVINRSQKFPFKNLYKTPDTLGIDRMVLAAGAVFNFPYKNCLIIDMGTCITYDYVTQQGHYLGGSIAPGMRLRFESLHEKTANLPLLSYESYDEFYGNTTQTAILNGVINGMTYELNGYIEDFQKRFDNFIIILTGGDSKYFVKKLKSPIFAESNFFQKSLKQLYLYQDNDQ